MSATLSALVRFSLQAGHWRLACRRYLMLVVSGSLVDTELRGRCEPPLHRLSSAELERMEVAAVSWAASHLPRQPLSLRTTQAAGTLLTQQQPNRFPAASRSRTRRAQRFAPSMAASRRNLAPSGAS